MLLAVAAGRFLGKESTLAAVRRAVQAQAPAVPAALSTVDGAEGVGGAMAAAAEAKVGIEQTVERVWATNNATVDALQQHLAQTVAETTARFRATATAAAAAANASAAAMEAAPAAAVDPAVVVAEALVSNETVNRTTILESTAANNTASLANLSANWTYLEPRLMIRMNKSVDLANFTHHYVHAIVDPHWGPRAVNATEEAVHVVAEAHEYSSAIDWQVQSALDSAKSAVADGEDAAKAAQAAMRTAEGALKQAQDNTLRMDAARVLAAKAKDAAAGSGHKASEAAQTLR